MSVTLKGLLRQRHWQTYETFCIEYDRTAEAIDPGLVGSWPSRAQFHRWLSGSLKGLPYPHHCRVLETMFPGHTAVDLFDEPRPLEHRLAHSEMQLITSGSELTSVMIEVVKNAAGYIVAVGSRSREPAYLLEIEHALDRKPDLVHYRILIGAPHGQVLKEHLLRLVDDERRRSPGKRKRLFVSILDDVVADHERFFVATDSAAVVVLPSANSPANFDTGLIVRDPDYVQGLVQHGKALYGRHRLETVGAVDTLEVLR